MYFIPAKRANESFPSKERKYHATVKPILTTCYGHEYLLFICICCCISSEGQTDRMLSLIGHALLGQFLAGHQLILTTSVQQGKSSHPCIFFS